MNNHRLLMSGLVRPMHRIAPASSSFLFVGLFGAIFLLLNCFYFIVFFLQLNLIALFYLVLVEYFTFGLAFELAEFILEFMFPALIVPSREEATDFPAVAVLYCTCDDLNSQALRHLGQDYPNLRIFILDDSRRQEHRAVIDSLGITVVRRAHHGGGKAGNLNNWLMLYGDQFPYFIILDADSILAPDFARKMIAYAEHPANSDVAIFESMVVPWNIEESFARHQAVLARCLRGLQTRVANRFHCGFSAGHNNLIRTGAVRMVGGFTENYVAEDYATSIRLLNQNWRCITVPVDSYERAPANLQEYAKRRMRHACQTFQLTSLGLHGLSWPARLRLVKSLFFYGQSAVYLAGAIFLSYLNFNYMAHHAGMTATESVKDFSGYFAFLALWCSILLLQIGCMLVRARAQHVEMNKCFKAMLFEAALFQLTAWPTTRRLLQYWLRDGRRLEFDVTATQAAPTFSGILKMAGPALLIYVSALISVLMNPVLSGLNLTWILPAVFSPIVIYWHQEPRHGRRNETKLA